MRDGGEGGKVGSRGNGKEKEGKFGGGKYVKNIYLYKKIN